MASPVPSDTLGSPSTTRRTISPMPPRRTRVRRQGGLAQQKRRHQPGPRVATGLEREPQGPQRLPYVSVTRIINRRRRRACFGHGLSDSVRFSFGPLAAHHARIATAIEEMRLFAVALAERKAEIQPEDQAD